MSWFEQHRNPYQFESFPSHTEVLSAANAAKDQFHQLFNNISQEQWDLKKAGREWTIKEIMVHVSSVLNVLPSEITLAREHRHRSLPSFVPPQSWDFLNYCTTVINAKRFSVATLPDFYDSAHEEVLAVIKTIQPDEWDKGAFLFGRFQSVAYISQKPLPHVQFHTTQIRKIIQIHDK